jgi:hypothetical protein
MKQNGFKVISCEVEVSQLFKSTLTDYRYNQQQPQQQPSTIGKTVLYWIVVKLKKSINYLYILKKYNKKRF